MSSVCRTLSTQRELGSIVGGACYSFVDTALPKRAVTVYEMVFYCFYPGYLLALLLIKKLAGAKRCNWIKRDRVVLTSSLNLA